MTYSDILTSLQNGVFVNVVAIGAGNGFLGQSIAYSITYNPSDNMIFLTFGGDMPFTTLFWLNDNTITNEEPGSSGAPN